MESIAFLLKKSLTAMLLPPGIFIVLLVVAILFVRKRLRTFLFALLLLLYLFSIEPVKDLLMLPLENAYPVPAWTDLQRTDAIVVLGGGVVDNAPDLDGPGTVSADSMVRVLSAYKLHAALRKPIIVTGGTVFGTKPESELSRKVLLKLGVKEQSILMEAMSKDTRENALYARDICQKRNWKRIILVTSAFHMKRAVLLFKGFFTEIVPFPTDYKSAHVAYSYGSFLPSGSNMAEIGAAFKEYMGIIFYKLTLRG